MSFGSERRHSLRNRLAYTLAADTATSGQASYRMIALSCLEPRSVADAIDCRVSARLAARRRRVGIDRALLDLLLEARDGTVERLETGRSRIAPSRLLQLAGILDVPIEWFFDEAQSETPPAEPVFALGGERQEARGFLALYARIADPKVRAEIREIVRSLAVASSRRSRAGASERLCADAVERLSA